MTLRDLGSNIQGWFDRTAATVSNEHILDWPIGVTIIVVLGCIIGFTVFSTAVGGFFGWLTGLVFKNPEELGKEIRRQHGIPSDPSLRRHWANRTGPYAPDADSKTEQ
ncbi:MAG: hypothetical protein A3D16_23505 [Rhodobacterales bacterium RIFCSPHIGHO2_02_FULL_62_130]|jgi:hypothetical protein|nr:MAG: hypothetical protein A3D16_23505 [Rhodobacterales bacterium RIFCSPHIGHO2_02_FULL_62_130]OHC54264.1 MAG: hypothetical protein A3E48_18995 [Rhodobacterales bacterium RIFCSPHIGHO2_12_FULL_62_75]HCY98586.1 hypothetical protein [Rhodobacter sp.]